MEVVITPATEKDVAEMRQLWQATEGMVMRDADGPEALARYFARNPGMSFCARLAGQLVGVALCGHDGRRGYLNHVAVASEVRLRGIGKALVERCLAALAADGIDKCHLFVHGVNERGKEFWRRLGWQERPEVELMSFVSPGKHNA
jgi:ribosomal protein S18 acetylase RimI-like enzyme